MKLVGAISTAVLSLALGAGIPAYAQQEQHDQQEEQKAKPAQEEKKAQPEKPARQEEKKTQEDKSAGQEEKRAKPEEKATQLDEKTSPQQEKANRQEDKNAQKPEQHAEQARPEQQAERSGRNGVGRIPDDHFRANFGQDHRFRVSENDYRNRRFQSGGYWFGFEGAWPSNWLYTQDVYVVEIDGVYYLCNANYPGVNIVLSVTL
jgi:hypothetical protein